MRLKIFFILLFLIFSFVLKVECVEISSLTNKEQNIVYISSYTAKGDLVSLEKAFNKALDEKLTIYEIKEVLIQMYAYCGFPRSLNAITTFMKVTDERSAKGGYDPYGTEPADIPDEANKNSIGTAVQTELVGVPVTGRIFDFEPAMDKFLKEHLFADIFARGVLTYEEREIATIGALASMKGVEPQLQGHIQIAKNIGISKEKIDDILNIAQYNTFKNEIFDRGEENTGDLQNFIGKSYLNLLNSKEMNIANITLEPGCRNYWHINHKCGQVLLVIQGQGYYQEWGKSAQMLYPGVVVYIPPEVKHWNGAKKDSWVVYVLIESQPKDGYTEWLESVSDEEYNKLK